MTCADIARLRDLLAIATAGPWEIERCDWQTIIVRPGRGPRRRIASVGGSAALGHNGPADADLIIALRNAAAELLDLAAKAIE